jgi:hypothetical protein
MGKIVPVAKKGKMPRIRPLIITLSLVPVTETFNKHNFFYFYFFRSKSNPGVDAVCDLQVAYFTGTFLASTPTSVTCFSFGTVQLIVH